MIRLSAFADEAGITLAEQIEALKKNNIPYIELRTVDGKNVAEFTLEEAEKYAKELADAGIKVWSIGSPLGKVAIDCDFDEYMNTVRHVFKLAKIFSCERIRMFSFYGAGKNDEDKVVEYLCRMVEEAAAEGLILCHENEQAIFGETVDNVLTLIDRVPGMRHIYDFANFVHARQDMNKAMNSLLHKVEYFHVKDAIMETEEVVPAGEGDGLVPETVKRISRDMVLSIEPHLAIFNGYRAIDTHELKGKYTYMSGIEAFDAAINGIKKVLKEAGYTENGSRFDKKMIKYGIIGMGNMGTAHLLNFQKGLVPDSTVTAIADLNQSKLDRATTAYPSGGFKCYHDGKELIDNADVDAVMVVVPHYSHPDLAIYAMRKGINVVVEKPAGVYTKQVKEMNAVADETGMKFTMMFNMRTCCLYRAMQEIIAEGKIGEIKRVNWIITTWYRPQSYFDSGSWRATWSGEGGGVLFNQCPHQLDLLQWVVGMMPVKMHAFCHYGKWHDIEVEDDVTAYFEYPNGATGVFITSTADVPGTNRFEITGTLGKILCDDKLGLRMYVNEMDEREFNATYTGGFGEPKWNEVPVEHDGKDPGHVGILTNFTNVLLGREELFVDGREGLKSVELMDAMELSSWLGKTIDMPFDDDLYYEELQKRVATGRRKEGADVVLDTSGSYNSQKTK